jgi:hypothetical protein
MAKELAVSAQAMAGTLTVSLVLLSATIALSLTGITAGISPYWWSVGVVFVLVCGMLTPTALGLSGERLARLRGPSFQTVSPRTPVDKGVCADHSKPGSSLSVVNLRGQRERRSGLPEAYLLSEYGPGVAPRRVPRAKNGPKCARYRAQSTPHP